MQVFHHIICVSSTNWFIKNISRGAVIAFLVIQVISYWSHLLFDCIEYNITIWYFMNPIRSIKPFLNRIESIILCLFSIYSKQFCYSIWSTIPIFSGSYTWSIRLFLWECAKFICNNILKWISLIEYTYYIRWIFYNPYLSVICKWIS